MITAMTQTRCKAALILLCISSFGIPVLGLNFTKNKPCEVQIDLPGNEYLVLMEVWLEKNTATNNWGFYYHESDDSKTQFLPECSVEKWKIKRDIDNERLTIRNPENTKHIKITSPSVTGDLKKLFRDINYVREDIKKTLKDSHRGHLPLAKDLSNSSLYSVTSQISSSSLTSGSHRRRSGSISKKTCHDFKVLIKRCDNKTTDAEFSKLIEEIEIHHNIEEKKNLATRLKSKFKKARHIPKRRKWIFQQKRTGGRTREEEIEQNILTTEQYDIFNKIRKLCD